MRQAGGLDFDGVYREYEPFVRRALTRHGVRQADLDDVVQETFVTVHKLLVTFEGRASLKTWLYAVAWRVASHYHRKRRGQRERAQELPDLCDELSAVKLPGMERLHESLGRIDPQDRDLFALYEVGGLSVAELSELVGSSRATISARLERARKALAWSLSSVPAGTAPALKPEPPFDAEEPQHSRDSCSVRGSTALDYEHPDYRFSRVGDTVTALWRGPGTAEAHEILVKIIFAALDETPDSICFMSMIEASSGPPDRSGREAVAWAVAKTRGKIRAATFVTEASGLMRYLPPIINSYVFLSRSTLNVRFFNDLRAGADWAAQHTARSTPQDILHHFAYQKACLERCAAP
jgi:RNA polymerase sigma-70 factor (ECF subfamily)